jgi:FkbM family methyltransferase
MATSTIKYLKFQGRAWLTRVGLWQRFERWRLHRRFKKGFIHEPDFRFFSHFEGSRGLFVDVGANIGQSALSFRAVNRTCPILSFEANPDMEYGLREVKRILGDDYDYRLYGLGTTTENRRLFVPYVNGVAFPQCATFRRDALENNPERGELFRAWTGTDRFDIVEKSIQLVRFDELNLNPDLVKIDVEGGELDVLTGMDEMLRRCRPILMTEGDGCRGFLRARSYEIFLHQPQVNRLRPAGTTESALNFFFVPAEKVKQLQNIGALESSFSARAA